jgi:hypothetical protein
MQMENSVTTKTAVDQAAKDYWISFYKEYGQTWVKDVPRKIKAALIANKRVAAKSDDVQPGQIELLAFAEIKTGGVRLEGVFKADKKLAFTVDFSKAGEVQEIQSLVLG